VILRRAVALLGVAALVACGDGGGSAEELCTAVRADHSTAAVFSGFDPTNREKALDQLTAARVTLGELRAAAPDEVRDDLDVEIDYVQGLIDGLTELDGNDPAAAVEVVRQVTEDHPDVPDAAAELATFSQEHCAP
jgi:hypothetical protein